MTYRARPTALLAIMLAYMLWIGACASLVFRWTNVPPEDQPYATPLRTRPPSPPRGLLP
jgi:hypothetical protein